MPTYVYKCKNCDVEFERVQRMTDEPVKICPECEGEVARLIFPAGVVFKGTGFHINDYPDTKSMVSGNGKKSSSTSDSKTETSAASS